MARGEERLTCPRCHRKVGVYVPRGGDGSLVYLRPHKDQQGSDGRSCPGGKHTEPVETEGFGGR